MIIAVNQVLLNERGIDQTTSIGTGTKVRINMTIARYPIILCFFRGKTSSSSNGADLKGLMKAAYYDPNTHRFGVTYKQKNKKIFSPF